MSAQDNRDENNINGDDGWSRLISRASKGNNVDIKFHKQQHNGYAHYSTINSMMLGYHYFGPIKFVITLVNQLGQI